MSHEVIRHAIAYYRVSRQGQAQSGLGLEAQRHAVEAYAARHGLAIGASFTEVETGTSKRQRVEIHKAIIAAKRHDAVLLIGKLDRLARSVAFTSNLMESGVNFVAVDMPDANRLTVHIMAALAEHEASLISDRTRDALARAKARGVQLGSPENLTDQARRKGALSNALKARKADCQVAGYAQLLRVEGFSYRRIAHRLNQEGFRTRQDRTWGAMQVKRVLDRADIAKTAAALGTDSSISTTEARTVLSNVSVGAT